MGPSYNIVRQNLTTLEIVVYRHSGPPKQRAENLSSIQTTIEGATPSSGANIKSMPEW